MDILELELDLPGSILLKFPLLCKLMKKDVGKITEQEGNFDLLCTFAKWAADNWYRNLGTKQFGLRLLQGQLVRMWYSEV